MKKFLVRVATGAVFAITLLGGMLCNKYTFGALFAIITMLSVREFCSLIHKYKKTTFSTAYAMLCGLCLFAAMFATYHIIEPGKPVLPLFAPYIILIVVAMIRQLFDTKSKPLDNFAYFILSQVYVALPFALLCMLSTAGVKIDQTYNFLMPLSIFIFIWFNDTGAFLFGCTLGRHKMFERVSPKKTWEGFAGGAFAAIGAGVALSHFSDVMSLWEWVGMGLVVVATATLGDLIESTMKREMQIKDSGNILPGHGGMLDRFDSTLLATPSVIAYLALISIL